MNEKKMEQVLLYPLQVWNKKYGDLYSFYDKRTLLVHKVDGPGTSLRNKLPIIFKAPFDL